MGISISYGITCCNEYIELRRLINQISQYVRKEDEIMVLYDSEHGSSEVLNYLENVGIGFINGEISFHRIFYNLNGDFASFKNFLKQHCTKEYLFQIDSDEYVADNLLENLPLILEQNPVDLFLIPRVNTVEGLTIGDINKWGWRVDEKMRVNWPDYQMRIIRNIPEIKWKNKVHEQIDGYKTIVHLPRDNEDWCLFHPKTIDRQRKQNLFYSNL